MRNHIKLLMLLPLCLVLLAACGKRQNSVQDVPRTISPAMEVAVATFTQPVDASQLIAGQIPENQGRITPEELLLLDGKLQAMLRSKTSRQYVFLPPKDMLDRQTVIHSSGQAQALPSWRQFGQDKKAVLLLVPQVLNWHQREGSSAGVTQSAHVRLEFFLLRVSDGTVRRSVYEEKQVGLVDNLLTVGSFIRRRGAWVRAEDLAEDAIMNAIKELGL